MGGSTPLENCCPPGIIKAYGEVQVLSTKPETDGWNYSDEVTGGVSDSLLGSSQTH